MKMLLRLKDKFVKNRYLILGLVTVNGILAGFFLLMIVNVLFLQWGRITPDPLPVKKLRASFSFRSRVQSPDRRFQSIRNLYLVNHLKKPSNSSDSPLADVDPGDIQKIETTSLPVELVGTMEGPSGYQLATLRNLKTRKIRSLLPGESWNNLTVRKVTNGSVILRNEKNGKTEILRLKRKYLAKTSDSKDSKDVRKVSRYEINQSIKSNMNNILTSVNPQPVIRNGRITGIQVSKMGGQPGELLDKLGFKKGDIIQRINGKKVDSIQTAMNLWSQLRNKRRVNFTIQRNGKKQVLEYSLTR